jgi:DHA1 family bicyclomycin/chloramphenicol resistance-like MFS transporter
VLQGLGAAAAAVVAMAIVRDLFTGLPAAKLLSRLMLVMGAAPILAPTLGGIVLNWTSWRGVFVVLALFGIAILTTTALGLPETLPVDRRRNGGVSGTLRDYGRLFTDRKYLGLILVAGLAMAALFAYVSGSSFVFQDEYGLSEQQFGFVFGAGAVGLITATQLNVRLLRRWTPSQILVSALAFGAVAGLALLLFASTGFGGIVGVLVPLWLVLASAGLAFPNAPALALSRHGEAAGTAAALLGAVQFGVGALVAPLVGVFGAGAGAMAAVVLLGTAAANLVLWLVVRPNRIPVEELSAAEPVMVAAH